LSDPAAFTFLQPVCGFARSKAANGRDGEMNQHISAFLMGYLVFMNLAAAALFWQDKRSSVSGGWRTPENTLLGMAFWGGSIGALVAQQVLRHKTRKQPFRAWLCAMALFHLAAAAVWLTPSLQKAIMDIAAQR
jgi:uncharacterized membrane protein YsdA (DUF1294 family)